MFGAPGMADVCLNLERGSGEPNALYEALVAEQDVCARNSEDICGELATQNTPMLSTQKAPPLKLAALDDGLAARIGPVRPRR